MQIIVDAKKDRIPVLYRGCGKTNLYLYHLYKWLESYTIQKPVIYECGLVLIKINEDVNN